MGWYNEEKVEKYIKMYPFETLSGINSIISGLQTITKLNEITSCQQILYYILFKFMFCFTIKELQTFYGIPECIVLSLI